MPTSSPHGTALLDSDPVRDKREKLARLISSVDDPELRTDLEYTYSQLQSALAGSAEKVAAAARTKERRRARGVTPMKEQAFEALKDVDRRMKDDEL